jgi:mycothiol synthase
VIARAEPPEGSVLRPARPEDAEAISDLTNASMVAETGEPWTTPEQIANDLSAPDVDLERERLLLLDRDGVAVGYLTIVRQGDPIEHLDALVWVRPTSWGLGFSAFLLGVAERFARDLAGELGRASLDVHVARAQRHAPAGRLFRALEYAPIRVFQRMHIELDRGVTEPVIPVGLAIRTYRVGADDRLVFDAVMEAFEDHWGAESMTFDDWRHRELASFDPSLWFVGVDGDEIAGFALCEPDRARAGEVGIVGELGVRRPWRRRGLASALLLTAFGAFVERGIRVVELGVDSESLTGATRLYERAGMRPVMSWEWWSKAIRAE